MLCLLDYGNMEYIVVVKPVWVTPILGACAVWGNTHTWGMRSGSNITVSSILKYKYVAFEFPTVKVLDVHCMFTYTVYIFQYI